MHLGMLSNLSVTMTGLERGLIDGKLSSRALLSIQLKPFEQNIVRQDDKTSMYLSSQCLWVKAVDYNNISMHKPNINLSHNQYNAQCQKFIHQPEPLNPHTS